MTDEYGTVLHNWGVDDGWGYRPGRTFTASNKTIEEAHSYIAYYNHWWLWMWNWHTQGVLRGGLSDITQAYLYTGDKRVFPNLETWQGGGYDLGVRIRQDLCPSL